MLAMQFFKLILRDLLCKKCSYFDQNCTCCHFETIYNFVILSVHNKNTNNYINLSSLHTNQQKYNNPSNNTTKIDRVIIVQNRSEQSELIVVFNKFIKFFSQKRL